MRILGLDIGEKYIGIAVSDALELTAQGLETLKRTNLAKDIEKIKKIIEQYQVDRIVIGLPWLLTGEKGVKVAEVLKFKNKLQEYIDLPLVDWDERLSTMAVERTLLEADVSRQKRKKVIDKLAAVYILQGYLDYKHMERKKDERA